MKINFTKREYRLLIDILEISEWVLNAHSNVEREDTKKYSELAQKIFSYAKEMGYEDLITYDSQLDGYFATREYEENGEQMRFIDEFEEDVFWDSLANKLAWRDLIQQEGQEVVEKMEFVERNTKMMELESWYQEELTENGLVNVKVVKEKSNKVN